MFETDLEVSHETCPCLTYCHHGFHRLEKLVLTPTRTRFPGLSIVPCTTIEI